MGKRLLVLLLALSAYSDAFGQLSVCAGYDVFNSHPDDLRTGMVIKCMVKGDTLFLDGAIDDYFIDELQTWPTTPIKKLYLNSGGGIVRDAHEIAEFIRENKITTIVRKGAKCMSACTLLFQAGQKRVAHPDSTFMYHSARYPHQSKKIKETVASCEHNPTTECTNLIEEKTNALQEITDQLFASYVELGATPELYQDYQKLDEADDWINKGNYLKIRDWYMLAEETQQYNVVQELTEELPHMFSY